MIIYLVRHGETDANKNGIMQGQSQNLQLNENGVRQASDLKNKLKTVNFDVCFTSPLIRAWSTAMILVGDRVEIKEDKRLLERYLGDFEGKNIKQIAYSADKYWDYKLNNSDEGVEAVQEIFRRCNSFIDDLKQNYNNDTTVLIVSHAAVIRCLHHLLKNDDFTKKMARFKIDNCYCDKYEI